MNIEELVEYEVKIDNKNSGTTKKCPMCGKPMVRECVLENDKFVYKERCCNLFCRRYATLTSGRYVVDAKSIMGIFSLALNKPVAFSYEGEMAAELAKEVQVYESQEV